MGGVMNEIYANLVPQVLKKSRAKTVETGSPVSTEKITHEDIQTRWGYGVSAPSKHHPRKWALSERKREKIQVDQQAQIHSGGLRSNGLPNQQNRIRFVWLSGWNEQIREINSRASIHTQYKPGKTRKA